MSSLDLQLLQSAIELGYTQRDIQPITYQILQQESYQIIKKMQPIEKEFYLQKKFKIYNARRQKILKEIKSKLLQNQAKRQNDNYNPKLRQIFSQHQKKLNKNQRYYQTLSRGLQSKSKKRNNMSNTIDFRAKSPYQSQKSIHSRTSQRQKKYIRSQSSEKSSSRMSYESNHKSETKLRLSQVRQKQLQAHQYKKAMLAQKIKHDQIKFLKAEKGILDKSRKVKTRSEISRKIVNENKKEMEIIKQLDNTHHLQNLKLKISTNQYKRSKYLEQLKNDNNVSERVYYVKQLHKQIQRSNHYKQKFRYEAKHQLYEQRSLQSNQMRRKSLSFNRKQKQLKWGLADERKSIQLKQQKQYRDNLLKWQKQRLANAQTRRLSSKQQIRMQSFTSDIRRQLISRNKRLIQTNQDMRQKQQINKLNEKIKEIQEITNIRKKLKNEELKVRKSMQINQKTDQSMGYRASLTSSRPRNAYFNTIIL